MTRKADVPDPLTAVRTLLERLNLTTAARRLAELLAQAETAQPSYSAFLHTVLEAEDGSRWERKLQRRRRWSRLGPPVSLDGFDWAARPQLSPQVVKELLTCRFIDEHRNVILSVDSVEDAVGKPTRDSSAYLSVDYLVLHRIQTNTIEEGIDLLHERPTETCALSLIPSGGLPNVRLGLPPDNQPVGHRSRRISSRAVSQGSTSVGAS